MAVFTGSGADDTYAGTGSDDTITSGGGKDTLAGGGGNDSFILNAPIANGSSIDGDAGTDTLVLQNFANAPVQKSSLFSNGIATTRHNLYGVAGSIDPEQNINVLSIERIRFESTAGTSLGGTLLFGAFGPYKNQIGVGAVSPTAELIGGAGNDDLILSVQTGAGRTVNAPAFTYTNWQTPKRAYLGGDSVTIALSGAGTNILNGSAHQGVQRLIGSLSWDTINGSDDMDYIDGGSGLDLRYGNGGDDTLAFIHTIFVNDSGEVVSDAVGSFDAQGVFDGGDGFDFLLLGGDVSVAAEVRNIEGLYLAPAYVNDLMPGDLSARQNPTAVSFSGATWAQMPADLLLAGTGTIWVNVAAGASFDGSGYLFAADAEIRLDLFAGASDDTIVATPGSDEIQAGLGDDVLSGGPGDDQLVGSLGNDTAIFSGDRADYVFSTRTVRAYQLIGPDGTDIVMDIETYRFDDGDYVVNPIINTLVRSFEPASGSFRMFAPDGFEGAIGGRGLIIGTNGQQKIDLISGANDIAFDASFNRGNDIIYLPPIASRYTARSEGSQAILEQDANTYSIPVGVWPGMDLWFGPERLWLGYEQQGTGIRIDGQRLSASPIQLTGTDGLSSPPPWTATGVALVLLTDDAELVVNGNYNISGTAGEQHVVWQSGDIVFDASFNRGGDTFSVRADADDIRAYLAGSRVILLWGDDDSASIPYGPTGMALDLIDGENVYTREIRYDEVSRTLFIGEQAITALAETTAVALIA